MEEIKIMEKPDWVSWDEIAECIRVGQSTNTTKGFDMQLGHLSREDLQRPVKGESGEGYTFVAINEQNKVVGTYSLTVTTKKKWWHKGKCGLRCDTSTLPEYRGTDVYFGLRDIIERKEKELGLNVIWATTSEKNDIVININKKLGWKVVEYNPVPLKRDYFSYVLVKWKNGCPHKDWIICFMFKLSRIYSRMVYTYNGKQKVNRFTHWMHNNR